MATALDNAWSDIKKQAAKTASLDPQEQSLGEMAGEFGAGLLPGVGQALSARDFERSRREDSKLGMTLAAIGMLPLGRVLSGGKNAVQRMHKEIKELSRPDVMKAKRMTAKLSREGMPDTYIRDEILNKTGLVKLPNARTRLDSYYDTVNLGPADYRQLTKRLDPMNFEEMFPKADLSVLSKTEADELKKVMYYKQALEDRSGQPRTGVGGGYDPSIRAAYLNTNSPRFQDLSSTTGTLWHETNHALQDILKMPSKGANSSVIRRDASKLNNAYTDLIRRGKFDEREHRIMANDLGISPEKLGVALERYTDPSRAYSLYYGNLGEISSRISGTQGQVKLHEQFTGKTPHIRPFTDAANKGISFTPASWGERVAPQSWRETINHGDKRIGYTVGDESLVLQEYLDNISQN